MNIVYQLLTGGDNGFAGKSPFGSLYSGLNLCSHILFFFFGSADIYAEVPWIELVTRPGMPVEELLNRLEAMPTSRPRAFKTHSFPPVLPLLGPDEKPNLRYIVVMRNPEEAVVSMMPFLEQHSDELFTLWGIPKAAFQFTDFHQFFEAFGAGFSQGLFAFLNSWWPLRHQSNVLFLHFADMKRDHEGSVKKIADFLGIQPSAEEWEKIIEYTSFGWMKKHDTKFDGTTMERPMLKPGAMVRKGAAGAAHEDGMTPELSARIKGAGQAICKDPEAVKWFYEGGALP